MICGVPERLLVFTVTCWCSLVIAGVPGVLQVFLSDAGVPGDLQVFLVICGVPE